MGNFSSSYLAFIELWKKFKSEKTSPITYVDAFVTYTTDVTSLNKKQMVTGIVLDNSDNSIGGRIDLPVEFFNENIYHGEFKAIYQDFSYDGNNFVISGRANPQKDYETYTVVLSDIKTKS